MREGLVAYAARQAAMLRGLGTQGAALWKKTLASRGLEDESAERKLVGSEVDGLAARLFRRHVADRPDDAPLPMASAMLFVEIADTSLDFDLGVKLRAYVKASAPEYWVADVNGRVIHQMWAPQDGAYAERRSIAFGAVIEAATIDGLKVDTSPL